MPKLVIFRGDSVDSERRLGRETVRIGRDVHNDVVLDDKTVTRFHAEVICEGGTYYIKDLESRNGVWVNKRRVQGKVPLELGVPVTVGAYELTLEDDIGTSDLSEVLPAVAGRTVVNQPTVAASGSSSASTTRGRPAAPAPQRKAPGKPRNPAVFWSMVGLATVLVCVVTYVAVRRLTARPAPPPQVAVVTPPPEPVKVEEPPATPPPVNPDIVAGYVQSARAALAERDFDRAMRDGVEPLLNLDPNNAEGLALKQEIEAAKAAPPPPPVEKRPAPKPVPEVVEVSGIPRRPSESPGEYNARAQRVQTNLREGLRRAEQDDYSGALSRFQAVDRDQKGYMNIDGLIADTAAKQKKSVEQAIENGSQNERAGQLVNAVRWYERALRFDPNSTAAQEKLSGVSERRTKEGMAALSKAEVFRKRNEIAKAVAAYQEAADLLPSTNDKKAEAQQWLDKLKQ